MSTIEIPKARSAADVAQQILAASKARRAAEAKKAWELPKGVAWALACNGSLGKTPHAGIIFAEGVDPRRQQLIHAGMWFATYKPIDQGWFKRASEVVCQECLANGEKSPLRVVAVEADGELGFCFQVPGYWGRFLHQVNVDQLLGSVGATIEVQADEPKKGSAKP